MSRSGDECIVALTDQWYLAYGESDWQATVMNHIKSSNFNGYNDKIMEHFDLVLNWLKEWACSRQFGLGTQLPWDTQWVIESLSDSTIYMAYYTIAQFLHGSLDNMSGTTHSPYGIRPEDLTDDVFNYIFLSINFPEGVTPNIPIDLLQAMKNEFDYWYPMDLRVSAKDLIPNHLTMSLYNHVEIWKNHPEKWPRGIYCNGHIMVDAKKMSKSEGNFLLLLECVELFSADATRFALADAGDTLEDANFDRAVANQAVAYLFNEEEWINEMIADRNAGKLRSGELMFMDRTFSNEIDYLVESTFVEYEKLCYREGIHRCWFDMTIARDVYRDWSARCDIPMHADVVFRFINALTVMISPICPHWSENIWHLLANPGSVCDASWPSFTPYDRLVRKQYVFFRDFLKNARQLCMKSKVANPKAAHIFIASVYEEKRITVLKFLQTVCDTRGNFPADLLKDMKEFIEGQPELKSETKQLMQFGAFMRDEAKERGPDALAIEMTFDQKSILEVCT